MRYLIYVCVTAVLATVAVAQVVPNPELRKNRNTYHPVMEILKQQRTGVTDAELKELEMLPLEAMWGVLRRLGYSNYCSGLKATRPDARMVGRALTIRYLPRRPDLVEAMQKLGREGDWPGAYNVRAAEEAKPGDVLVVDLGGGVPDGIFFGDISALGAQMAGARGAVLYGSTRDLAELREMPQFPVFAVGFDPSGSTQIGVDWNVPIRVGSATVLPGDVVIAEEEAVLFFPPQLTEEVIRQAKRVTEREEYERKLAREKKHRFRDVYPLSPELRRQFEAQRKQQEQ